MSNIEPWRRLQRRVVMLVLLGAYAVTLSANAATNALTFELPRVAFEDILSQDESTSIFVAHQLVSLGALQITGVPQLATARADDCWFYQNMFFQQLLSSY